MPKVQRYSAEKTLVNDVKFQYKPLLIASMIKPDRTVFLEEHAIYFYQSKKEAKRELELLTSLLGEEAFDSRQRIQVLNKKGDHKTPFHFFLSRDQHETLKAIQGQRRLIKSIRWDASCFFNDFILGITPTEKNRHRQVLRPGKHKAYTVFAHGVYAYDERPSPYPQKKLDRKKRKRSQHQSTSLVSHEILSPVFGLDRKRQNKLAGVILDEEDAMPNRRFARDSHTVVRPYEHDTLEEAQRYHEKITQADNPRALFADRDAFETALKKSPHQHNEVLARIRWKVSSSAIGIFNDTFEARAVAHYYAEQMYRRLREQYEESGLAWDEEYQVPILYYLGNDDKTWTRYTDQDRQKDRKKAQDHYDNQVERTERIEQNNGEFLLFLDDPKSVWANLLQDKTLPLMTMLNRNQFQLLEALYQRTGFSTPLHEALTSYAKGLPNQKDVVQQLNPNLILKATECNKLSILKFCLNLGFPEESINMTNASGKSALYIAAQKGRIEVVNVLLKAKGIDVNLPSKDGRSPLYIAAQAGQLNVVKALLKHPSIHVNQAKIGNGPTPLQIALKKGHFDIVKRLLKTKDIDINQTEKNGLSPLHTAVNFGCIDIVKALLKVNGINVNGVSNNGQTPLYQAVINGHFDIVKTLLKVKGINVNITDNNSESPLFAAAKKGELNIVNALLKMNEIDVNQKTTNDWTPLLTACRNEDIAIIKTLLEVDGINVNQTRKHKKCKISPLLTVAKLENFAAITALIKVEEIDIEYVLKNLNSFSPSKNWTSVKLYLKQCIKHPEARNNPYQLIAYALRDYINTEKKNRAAKLQGFFNCNKHRQPIDAMIELLKDERYSEQEWNKDLLVSFFEDAIDVDNIDPKGKLAAILKLPSLIDENGLEDENPIIDLKI